MTAKLKRALGWIFLIYIPLLFIDTAAQSLSWVLVLGICALFCPPLMALLDKLNKKPKFEIRAGLGVVLFIIGMMLLPVTHTSNESNNLYVHFIDVGQGDSILIESDNHYMLIDAGEDDKGTDVANYLKREGVERLDYVIGSHPHSDHIGGLDTVIRSFNIGKIILPNVIYSTSAFSDLIMAIRECNFKITEAVVGTKYKIGSAYFTIIAPNCTNYSDLNNYSVGIKLVDKNNSFILAGDAEAPSEMEMTQNGIDLSADVLKLSHHGSLSSSSKKFLDAVTPSYIVISVGKSNTYNHPNKKVMRSLLKREVEIYRTDQQGTIIFTSDGNCIQVQTEK